MCNNSQMITRLPLFPLGTVVFPGMPLPLHIFESRYKKMIAACLEKESPFGVLLIREGTAVSDPNVTTHSIGCSVEIVNSQDLENGRLFIMSVGQQRFQLLSLKRDVQPYFVGDVEFLTYTQEDDSALATMTKQLHPLILEYLELLAKVGRIQFDPHRIPQEPQDLACLAASLLNIPADKKQTLLTISKVSHLFRYLIPAYIRELKILRMMPPNDETSSFSLN